MTTISVNVTLTDDQLQLIVDALNIDITGNGEKDLTLDEVKGNEVLLYHIVKEAVDGSLGFYDPLEFWNEDGWSNWKDFR